MNPSVYSTDGEEPISSSSSSSSSSSFKSLPSPSPNIPFRAVAASFLDPIDITSLVSPRDEEQEEEAGVEDDGEGVSALHIILFIDPDAAIPDQEQEQAPFTPSPSLEPAAECQCHLCVLDRRCGGQGDMHHTNESTGGVEATEEKEKAKGKGRKRKRSCCCAGTRIWAWVGWAGV